MAWLIENWRDAILMAVALLAVYVVFSIMRLVQMSRTATRVDYAALHRGEHHVPTPDEERQAAVSDPVWSPLREPGQRPMAAPREPVEIAPLARNEAAVPVAPSAPAEPVVTTSANSRFARFARWGQGVALSGTQGAPDALAPAARNEDFASELRQTQLESEMSQLRRESESLREELAAVQEELTLLKSARNVSPLYSEAAALAQKGVPADGIAGQCGISLGEAELVAALAMADGRRIEPTEYLDPNDSGNSNGQAHGGQPNRHRRTGTHG
jgi:hypothetical protein